MAQSQLTDLEPETANALQHEWIQHVKEKNKYGDFYIFDENGQLWLVGPDNQGEAITAVPIVTTYSYGDDVAVYPGPDAWNELFEDLNYKFSLPEIHTKFENTSVAKNICACLAGK